MKTYPVPPPIPSGNDKADIANILRYLQNNHGQPIYTHYDTEFSDTGLGPVLVSPNGSRWRLTVDNSGVLTAVAA